MEQFNTLREQNNKFVYESYKIVEDDVNISLIFTYKLIEQTRTSTFTHKLRIEKAKNITFDDEYANIVFHIGLIEAINYWKIATPKEFKIECGYINKEQIQWFKKLYYNGLGEFLYLNQISIIKDEFIDFKVDENGYKFKYIECETKDNNIIPIGGGKDSLVTYELLKDTFPNSYMFSMNPIVASQNILNQHPNNSIVLSRILDKQILEFNRDGYLNGHIPFSSIVGFISIWLGILYRTKYIVLSNESSANEGNVIFNDLEVNHQYSKSFEFENDFRGYIKDFITSDVEYFSFLRPLDEIHIAKLFSLTTKHFDTFLSCNVGSRKNIWCGKCPKCMFTYIMLCNFIEDEVLHKIFGKDMLDDIELESIFYQLFNDTEVKPFECVGTYDEVNYALQRKKKEYSKDNMPYLLNQYTSATNQDYNFKVDYKQTNLPQKFKEILESNVKKLNF